MKMMMRIPNNSVLVVAVALFAAAAGSMDGMATGKLTATVLANNAQQQRKKPKLILFLPF
jgi:hypothetical protein